MKKTRNPKRASFYFDDAAAFRLVTEMWRDCEAHIPKDLYDHVLGRFRRRDYTFVIDTFPKFGLSLMQYPESGGVTLLNGKAFDMGAIPKRTYELVYAVSHLLKKYPFSGSSVYTDEFRLKAARFAFRKAEKWCYRLNRSHGTVNAEFDELVKLARRTCFDLLGDCPDVDRLIASGYYGPGVNIGVNGKQTDAQWKFSLPITITRSLKAQFITAAQLMPATMYHYGIMSYLEEGGDLTPDPLAGNGSSYERFSARGAMDLFYNRLETCRGNRVCFVPKDAKTLRAIACEPMANSYFQNGLGAYMVETLAYKSTFLDLYEQSRNRELALTGSKTGSFATIDLSSASDTISKRLVKLILPPKWYRIFSLLRSPRYLLDGKWIKSEKISSMGNGYTFPLESLLFYSIARAATVLHLSTNGHTVRESMQATRSYRSHQQGIYEPSVYGDDIVVRTDVYDAVTRALKLCGFWINNSKSYSTGPFRESCGHDYYCGEYVRPIFLKKKIQHVTQVITLINQLSHPEGLGWLTERFGVVFSNLFTELASLSHRFNARLQFGPFKGRVEDGFVCAPVELLRSRGHLSEDTATQRWVYHPISVVPVTYPMVSDYGAYLKGLHSNKKRSGYVPDRDPLSLVVRGSFRFRYPKKSTSAKGLITLPSVDLGEVPENIERWMATLVRYIEYYPLLKGW